MSRLIRLIAVLLLATPAILHAQTSTIPALFLSDIHFDPFHDPAKVARLNYAPVSEWNAILAQPDSRTRLETSAKLKLTCPTRGADTDNALWQSALHAIHSHPEPRFVTLSGDLLAHSFDCKYKALLPAASSADYLAFVQKTIRYQIAGLRAAVSSAPIYIALGNNDSACTDYRLDATHDVLLAAMAQIVAENLPEADRPEILATFPQTGSYTAPLAGVPHTRIVVLDDLFLSGRYATCAGTSDPAPAEAQLGWLKAQLDQARQAGDHVWILGHIPPGIDLYSSARKLTNICGGGKPVMFLSSSSLADVLADNADVIRLALFGHTHSDEFGLLTPSDTPKPGAPAGVPLKVTASITPVNGNRPTFTLARVDPSTATLKDYTVIEASNNTGIATTWSPEYTYSSTYHEPSFNAASVSKLIDSFQADPQARQPASQAYLRDYFPGDMSSVLVFAWPQYACSMDHASAKGFADCVCKGKSSP